MQYCNKCELGLACVIGVLADSIPRRDTDR
jgi:hypothetical protein